MAVRRMDLERDMLLRRYMEARLRHGEPEKEEAPAPGYEIRSCTRCGRHTMFRLDPQGSWYECTRCGHYA